MGKKRRRLKNYPKYHESAIALRDRLAMAKIGRMTNCPGSPGDCEENEREGKMNNINITLTSDQYDLLLRYLDKRILRLGSEEEERFRQIEEAMGRGFEEGQKEYRFRMKKEAKK